MRNSILICAIVYSLGVSLAYSQQSKTKEIYVSPTGADVNPGTIISPFKTIKAAIKKASPGSVITLREGEYRESVELPPGTSALPITLTAYQREKVIISGVQKIAGWKKYKDDIYFVEVHAPVSQVFVGGEQMVYARWPNTKAKNVFDYKNALANKLIYRSGGRNSEIYDTQLMAISSLDLTGSKIWLPYPISKAWNSFTEDVVKINNGNLLFSSNNYFEKGKDEAVINQQSRKIEFTSEGLYQEVASDVKYYLTGSLALLDSEKEWFYDEKTSRLYFSAPGGNNPESLNVLARTRRNGVVVNGDHTQIKNIEFFAATASIKGNYNTIENCAFIYPLPFYNTTKFKGEDGVLIIGNFNTIKRTEVSRSWGSGISMLKSEDGLIEDCLVHEVNWSGSISPGISVDGTRMTVKSNTIYACGRSGIRHYYIYNSLIEKNHIYEYGKINTDLGGIKGGLQDYKHSIWRYNFIHDNIADRAKAGIYLDASNDNAVVDHNVLYNVHLGINGEVNNDSVFNNTLVSNLTSQKVMKHFQRFSNWDYRSVYLWNNLSTNSLKGTSMEKNLLVRSIDSIGFVGYDYGDFRLLSTSLAIDKGRRIDNINKIVIGNAPDAGAYEYGSKTKEGNWMPGITWSPVWNQLPTAKIKVAQGDLDKMTFSLGAEEGNDADGWIMRYDWDFGDGTLGYGKSVTHKYGKSGNYQVKLLLQDNLGGKTIRKISITASKK